MRDSISRNGFRVSSLVLLGLACSWLVLAVPTDVQMPGTQPREVTGLGGYQDCTKCHGGYDQNVEPGFNWHGTMMSHAGRDPLFWATVAVAEQDFKGAGDLCLRCHAAQGWLEGRSEPTDGSGLAANDGNGVECTLCHRLTNPDDSEHVGVQNAPFVANDGGTPAKGYYGNGMYVLLGDRVKLGPYASTVARHAFKPSKFHRSSALCGTCHDVSNPVVGDLAHNNGAPVPLPPGQFSGKLGGAVTGKAAFKNFPFLYGVVERTFSEHQASAFATKRVRDYATLPAELQDGAIEHAHALAQVAGKGGDYEDGTTRLFSCQTCHMPPATGKGCNKNNAPLRKDLPMHEMVGGNFWTVDAVQWLDARNKLRLGGGLTATQIAAMKVGQRKAKESLSRAGSLEVRGDTVRLVNLTGHKLLTGFPEGRRMWLNVKWYDLRNQLVREDGAYGQLNVDLKSRKLTVESLLDLKDPNARVWEAKPGMTQRWASQLLSLNKPSTLPLAFDRTTGNVTLTLGQLAARPAGTQVDTFHFAINNTFVKDNRIPPFGMSYDEAKKRNVRPVPETLYGNPGPGKTYQHWDDVPLNPPPGAVWATIDLLYQPTSWEYVQFLFLANDRSNQFLAEQGQNLLDAWLATGMAKPHRMASATWCGLRGSGEDLTLESTIDAAGDPRRCIKGAKAGQSIRLELDSPGDTLTGAFSLLVLQLYVTGFPPKGIPTYPELHVSDVGVHFLVPSLPKDGFKVTIPSLPAGLKGLSVRFQGLAFSARTKNKIFAASDAHDVVFE